MQFNLLKNSEFGTIPNHPEPFRYK